MSIFGLDTFDERIEAVQNKAGRIAFETMYITLMLSLVVYTQVTGKKSEALEYFVLGIATLGMLIFRILCFRKGITWQTIREEEYRIGKSSNAAKRYLRKQTLFILSIPVVVTLASSPIYEVGWGQALFLGVLITIGCIVTYKSTKTHLMIKPESHIKAKKTQDE